MRINVLCCLLFTLISAADVSSLRAQSPASAPEPTTSQTETLSEEESVRKEVARQMTEREKSSWKFGIRPNGGGFFLSSPDEKIQFRLLGYAQGVASLLDRDFVNSFESGDFRVRRARVGWLMTFDKMYELFIEYDGVPETGNLVEARLNWQLRGDDVQLRVGKFVVPFSEEGWRSSRNYDVIERFVALNSMYGLPALDTQIGAMIHGQVMKDNKLTYYAGLWNGNASAASNPRDSNGDKEFQVKVAYRLTKELRVGVGLDHTVEVTQPLRLSSLTGTRYVAVDVQGKRQGIDADFFYEKGRMSFRGEGMTLDFADSKTQLNGAFLQAAYFLRGDYNKGFQPLVRIERSQVRDGRSSAGASSSAISILTAGFNWFLSNNIRLQVNAIGEDFSQPRNLSVRGDGLKTSLLTELQYRF